MSRSCWAILVLLVTAGAGPVRPQALPVPPIPPPHPPIGQSAPLPDRDIQGPTTDSGQGPRVRLQDFRVQRYNPSLGYAPGSQFETSEEKRPIQTPGLTVQVPLR